jgi:hypothetical protein
VATKCLVSYWHVVRMCGCVYLRHTRRRKDGKTHVYWQLVRSIRRGRKVVQQMVAQLGELDGEGRARAEALARSIAGRASESSQGQLFDSSEPSGAVAVKLDGVRLERSRSFGAVWLGWILWRALKLDELCGVLLACKRQTVSWSEVIAILVSHWTAMRAVKRAACGRALVSHHGTGGSAWGSRRRHLR